MPPPSPAALAAACRRWLLVALVGAAAGGCDGAGERESPAAALAVDQATDDAVSAGLPEPNSSAIFRRSLPQGSSARLLPRFTKPTW